MKIVLAIDHVEIQRYFSKDSRLMIAAVVQTGEELINVLDYIRADTVILSRNLKYSGSPMELVERIMLTRKDLKIIYLYGAEDEDMELFQGFLHSQGIFDCHYGASVSSVELNSLIFGTCEKGGKPMGSLWKRSQGSIYVGGLDAAVITLYSNSPSGKSHTAWNLAYALGQRGYGTTLINIDRGYSANIFFGVDEIYYDLLDYMVSRNDYPGILDSCFRRGNVKVITGRLGSEAAMKLFDFQRLLYFAKARSDIVILDTHTGTGELTAEAINSSSVDFLVFDCDLMHFHMNKLMLDKLGSNFIPDKTIALINNCNTLKESYKFIYKQLHNMNISFKAVLPLSGCDSLSCDLMHTDKSPYTLMKEKNSFFHRDMEAILGCLKARGSAVQKKYKAK